jgi:oxepin-CoA hydrolase/3-oxo-5,6-dehydrosuberyl-CoA semialdehyde dehydrogenase
VLAFTGSAATAARLRCHPRVLAKGVRVNVEADSLNAVVLGPDVRPGSDTWKLFVRETAHEMTQKAGQKCTATRRVLVPRLQVDAAQEALVERLAAVRLGDPRSEGIGMGPVASPGQAEDVRRGVAELLSAAEVVYGDPGRVVRHDGGGDDTCFVSPVLLRAREPHAAEAVHRREVFGPVATLMPYDGSAEDAAALVALGEGSLVTSVYSDDREFVRAAVLAMAAWNGRVNIGSADVARESWGPGAVLPGLVHGGPGRAGGGEELGGLRGVQHYMQRTALEGSRELVEAILSEAAPAAG